MAGLNLLQQTGKAITNLADDSVKHIKSFNKSGARLTAKEVGLKFENGQNLFHEVEIPEGAITGSFVQGERKFGKEGFSIVSFFDKKGKIIERHRFNIVDGLAQKESRSWYSNITLSGGQYNGKYTIFQKLFRRNTFNYNECVNENLNMFIDNAHTSPQITRAITTYKPGGGNLYKEPISRGAESTYPQYEQLSDRFTFSLEEFGAGLKRKSFKSKVDYSPGTGNFHTFSKPINTVGLSEQEITQLSSDRYLPLKLHSGINRYEFLKKDVFYNTGINPDFPIKYKIGNMNSADGAYIPDIDEFNFMVSRLDGFQIPFPNALVTLAHEARHKKQFDLINAFIRKELTDPNEIELAKKFSKALRDKDFAKFVGKYKYKTDGLEIDAFAYEKEYWQKFYQDRAPIENIFNPNIKWLLE